MKKDDIDKFLEDNKDLMKSLADAIRCPGCQKIVHGPKFNLGEKFNWNEGCEECSKNENSL